MAKILIVDDSRVARTCLRSQIQKCGTFEIIEAGDGEAGMGLFREHRPDLTFLDLTMPEVDGFAVLETLRKESAAPIVILTADVQAGTRERVLGLGATEMLPKPPQKPALAELLARVLAAEARADG